MRVGYARQSKTDQADALDRQVSRLREAGCDEIIEELISGGDNERPGILQLIKLIERRQVDEILLTRVDRLGRDAWDSRPVNTPSPLSPQLPSPDRGIYLRGFIPHLGGT